MPSLIAKSDEWVGLLPSDRDQYCIVCGSSTTQVLGNLRDNRLGVPGEYCIHRCTSCRLEQLVPRPLPGELKQLYEKHYNFGGEYGTKYARLREKLYSSSLYGWWLAIDGDGAFHARRGSGRLLDIGCNEGRGLKIYTRNGYAAEGLELNARAAAIARSAGFEVCESLLEDFTPAALYDVVVLSNVLEHSLDPTRMLKDVMRILKPGGQVWISCPNSASWQRRVFGRCWINWHVPFHIVQFSDETLRHVLSEAGFTRPRIRQISPALWMASSVLVWLSSVPGKPTRNLRRPLMLASLVLLARGLLFPVLWMGNQLGKGDCLLAIASKP